MIWQDRYVGSVHVHAVCSLHAAQSHRQEAGSFHTRGCTSLSCLTSTLCSLQSACVSNSVLPGAQATLLALPDELLGGILRRAWAVRPPRRVAGEVRAAAGLACVCRRWRELLRAQPLPLALDFSTAPLSTAQRRWLLEPAQAGRVEAASFLFEDDLWDEPLLGKFWALHGRTLLQLSGVPLRLAACASQGQRPALDLSGLRLTKLGVDCYDIYDLMVTDGDDKMEAKCLWLWPERLPGALEQLELLGLYGTCLEKLAWAPQPDAGLAGRLPQLHTLRVECCKGATLHTDSIPLLEGFPVLPAFEMGSCGADVLVHAELFGRVRSVRMFLSGVCLCDTQEAVATLVARLCPAGLQAAELRAEYYVDLPSERLVIHDIVREIISMHSDRFAVEVEVCERSGCAEDCWEGTSDDDGECWNKSDVRRLAWRRWPAPGAPDLPAARAAHERARAWAAAGVQHHPEMYQDEYYDEEEDDYGGDDYGAEYNNAWAA
jgi:hypothetical protein